jgi:hypothetical protein
VSQIPGGSQIARAYLLPSSGQPLPFRDYTVNRTAWADSYMSDQPSGFVFARPDLADAAFLALEKLLRIRHEVRLPPSALEASKRNSERIQDLKQELSGAGYYKNAPFDIRPLPNRLKKADVHSRVERVAKILAPYQEPCDGRSVKSQLPSLEQGVLAWLRQFDHEEHIDCALSLLGKFRMLDRADTVGALRAFIAANPQFRGGVVVPFGSSRDSGAVQAYFSADLIGKEISECRTLDEYAKSPNTNPVIFIDDFIASGGQGQDILAAGFGVPSLRKQLGEQRDMFSESIRERLQQQQVAFVFTAAWNDGLTTLEKAAKDLGLDAVVYGHIGEDELPFAFENCLEDVDPSVRSSFEQRCRDIGLQLVATSPEGETAKQPEKKLKERALGYGNRAMLLASPVNVPTQTLTLVWSNGEVDGIPWMPLLARRKKS